MGFTVEELEVVHGPETLHDLEPDAIPDQTGIGKTTSIVGWKKTIMGFLIAILVSCILSIPSILYVFSQTLPGGENTLEFSNTLLIAFGSAVGFCLNKTTSFIIPKFTRKLSSKASGGCTNIDLSLKLVMVTMSSS